MASPIKFSGQFFLYVLLATPFLQGQENDLALPRIERLDNRDTAFVQYLSDVEAARRRLYLSGEPETSLAESLTVYCYEPGPDETILTLSARCNIPYSALVTINRFSNASDPVAGLTILLPSVSGLFIPETPQTELELLLYSSRAREEGIHLTINDGRTKTAYRFLMGEDFYPTERIFFLNRGFTYPLRNFRVTSAYGPRQNPVTGNFGIHRGLDLAAPEGTPVYASREGRVIEQGEDPVLGKFIILGHENNWASVYGHLSGIETVLRQQVNSGNLIGRVGSTGQSTGPHLHFELRHNGGAQDPEKLLRLFQGN